MVDVATRFTGVILAAGAGRRMGVIGEALPKACLPLGNRPLIHHHLDLLATLGVARVVVVVGYKFELIREAVAQYSDGMASTSFESVTFVEQHKRLGIAHALLKVEPLVPDNMVVILGDTYFIPDRLQEPFEIFATHSDGRLGAVLSVRVEPNAAQIRKECTIRLDSQGRLQEIHEKPEEPFNELKPCGMYFFSQAVFAAIRQTPASSLRDEVEISDSIQTLVDSGKEVRCAHTVAWDMNLNTPAELWWCNQVELHRRGEDVWEGAGARRHPGAVLQQSVLGNGAEIGEGVDLRNCLVLDHTKLINPGHYRDAILGFGMVLEVTDEDRRLLPPVPESLQVRDGLADLVFRAAQEGDGDRLFRWVNQKDSLEAKVKTTGAIPRSEHDRWLSAALISDGVELWILELEGNPVGQARLERGEVGMEIDIFVAAVHRRRGLASRALEFLWERRQSRWPEHDLIARIRPDNRASVQLFEKSSYEYVEHESNHLLYRRRSA